VNQKDDFDFDLAIPDLDTDAGPAASKPSSSTSSTSSNDDFDFGEAMAGAGSALDGGFSADQAGGDFAFGGSGTDGFSFDAEEDDFDTFGAGSLSLAQQDLAHVQKLDARDASADYPAGTSPNPEDIDIDPVDVDVFAGYGRKPASPVLAPAYSWHVFRRKRELKAQLATSDQRITAAELERDRLLSRAVEEQRPRIEKNERFGKLIDDLKKVEDQQAERSRALEGANAEYGAEVGKIDAETAKLDAQAHKLEAERAARQKNVDACAEVAARANAQYKRVAFEARALKNAAEKAEAQGQKLDPSAQLSALAQKAAPLTAQAQKAEAALNDARAKVAEIEELKRRLTSERGKLQKQRKEIDKRFEPVLGLRSEGVQAVDEQKLAIFAEIGRAVMSLHGGIPVDKTTLEAIRKADAAVLDGYYQQKLRLLALDGYDRAAFKQGAQIIAAAGALLVALLMVGLLTGEKEPEVNPYLPSQSSAKGSE
jgi:hypothetical protein